METEMIKLVEVLEGISKLIYILGILIIIEMLFIIIGIFNFNKK